MFFFLFELSILLFALLLSGGGFLIVEYERISVETGEGEAFEWATFSKGNTRQFVKQAKKTDCMVEDNSSILPHPKSPYFSLPADYSTLLHPSSTRKTVCDRSLSNLRILIILHTLERYETRFAIRDTYGNFSAFNLQNNWTRFFLVGRPETKEEEAILRRENEQFGDIVVANVADGYFVSALKMLVALKFVSCFCPNAQLIIKADDDNYIRMKLLDSLISQQQSRHSNMFMGWCGNGSVLRPTGDSQHDFQVGLGEYTRNSYPPSCAGVLYALSMSVVRRMAHDCPRTCIGLNPREHDKVKGEPCLWRFEDLFVGSCVHFTQPDTQLVNVQYEWVLITSYSQYTSIEQPPHKHLLVTDILNYEQMSRVHSFYSKRQLLF